MSTKKIRLDQLMVREGFSESRNKAQRMIMAGEVRLNGELVFKPSHLAQLDSSIEIDIKRKYVSRGGVKLEAALMAFDLAIDGKVCADIGASTGGFTDVLIQNGARKVFAVDVGNRQLHWKLRNDPKVVVMEGVNARYLQDLPELVDLVTVDVSFISLNLILPQANNWLRADGDVVALIKPQFEAGPADVGRGGVVRDPSVHEKVLRELLGAFTADGWNILGLIRSPLRGPKGNIEFLTWLKLTGETKPINLLIQDVLDD